MKTIWKFDIFGDTPIIMPVGAQILGVGVQDDNPYLWALVDTLAGREERRISVVGTGWEVPESGVYLGTYFTERFVWHIFEEV